MKTRFLSATLALSFASLVASTSAVRAQDIETLMREMRGETPAATRDAAAWQTAYAQVLAALLPDMASDDLGKRADSQTRWEKIVLRASRPGAEAERSAISRAMLARAGADTPLEARLWLLKMLEWSARGEAVPTLAGLLADSEPQIVERARRALANNSAPEAGAALLQALTKATTPASRAALINALGFRREARAVPMLQKALADADETVAPQAVRALANIATPQAVAALVAFKPAAKLQPLVQTELIDAAARVRASDAKSAASIYAAVYNSGSPVLKAAALRGLVQVRGINALPLVTTALANPATSARAARLTLLMPGANAARALAASLPKLPAEAQVRLLPALSERAPSDRDATLNTAIAALVASTSATPEVKGAAARALGELGSANDVASLLKLAAVESESREGARAGLGRLGVARRDGAIVEAKLADAANGADTAQKIEAVRALSAQRAAAGVPIYTKLLDDASGEVRLEAARALGENGNAASVPVLAAWMARTGETGPAESALRAIFNRSDKAQIAPTPLLQVLDAPGLKPNVRASAFKLLGQLGSRAGFERVRSATADANEDVRDTAIRSLADWPSPEAIPDLIQIARKDANPVHQVLALRGVARLAPSAGDDAAKVAAFRKALSVAKRGEEKQLLLSSLASVRSPQAAALATPLLDDAALRDEAASAILKIARELRDQPFQDVRPSLQAAFDVAQDANLKKDLREQLDRK